MMETTIQREWEQVRLPSAGKQRFDRPVAVRIGETDGYIVALGVKGNMVAVKGQETSFIP